MGRYDGAAASDLDGRFTAANLAGSMGEIGHNRPLQLAEPLLFVCPVSNSKRSPKFWRFARQLCPFVVAEYP
jgi:hypothetical protein